VVSLSNHAFALSRPSPRRGGTGRTRPARTRRAPPNPLVSFPPAPCSPSRPSWSSS